MCSVLVCIVVYYVWCVLVCAMLEMLRPCRAAVVVAVLEQPPAAPASTTSAQSPVTAQQPRRQVSPAQPSQPQVTSDSSIINWLG